MPQEWKTQQARPILATCQPCGFVFRLAAIAGHPSGQRRTGGLPWVMGRPCTWSHEQKGRPEGGLWIAVG